MLETLTGLPPHLRHVYTADETSVDSAAMIKKAQKPNWIAVDSVQENTLVKLGLKSASDSSDGISRKDELDPAKNRILLK